MTVLALHGGKPAINEPLRPFNHITQREIDCAVDAMKRGPLSGYLGGVRRGGFYVEALEEYFRECFHVTHAVACNSATSGLLLACMACGVGPGTVVGVPAMTMSATAAAPAFLGARLRFGDVVKNYYCSPTQYDSRNNVEITTNLFGHPAYLRKMRMMANAGKTYLIEDNAQGMLAMEDGHFAGTIGHIGVFSFNVHKHIQCGEGGIVVTNDDSLADALYHGRNHGELAGRASVGLNLRMTEVQAAIVLAQMRRVHLTVERIVEQAMTLSEYIKPYEPLIWGPVTRRDCRHSFYIWAIQMAEEQIGRRGSFVAAMNAEGFPLNAGYVTPLYRLPAFKQNAECPNTEYLHDHALCTFENCLYDMPPKQMQKVKEALDKACSHIGKISTVI